MKKRTCLAILAALLSVALLGCQTDEPRGTETAPTTAPTEPVYELALVVTEDTIAQL